MKVKSSRNKTIDTSVQDGMVYLNKCIQVNSCINDISSIINSTILGNMFDVVPLLPNNCIDLVVVDPPYNLTKNFNGNVFYECSNSKYEEYTRKWLELIVPMLKSNGSIYVCCDCFSSLIIGKVLQDYFIVRNRITWQRDKGRGSKSNWKNCLEDIWFATKGNEYTFNLDAVKIKKQVIAPYRDKGVPKDWIDSDDGKYRYTCPSNFWNDITIPFWSMKENTAHPTQKPEKLLAKLILASSNENDLVLDPFVGSGTTSVVCKKLNRNYIGIECDKQYCIWCEQRLSNADTDNTIQGYYNGLFLQRNENVV